MNDLIFVRLKEIKQLQDKIKLKKLDYKAKSGKRYNFSKDSLPITFLRVIYTNVLSIANAYYELKSYMHKWFINSKCL